MEKLPEDWLYATLNRIEERMTEHGKEMRAGFQSVRDSQFDHQREDDRVHAEVKGLLEREKERGTDIKAGRRSFETLGLSTGLIVVWETAKHLLGWK